MVGVVVVLALLVLGPAARTAALAQGTGWGTSFDGRPGSPEPWNPPEWDIQVHSRDRETWRQLDAMAAHHGPDCSAAPATHQISAYEQAVFKCNDHIMTAINAGGYGLVVLTPNQLVDLSGGETVIRFDMSTFRSSPRDWVSVWLSPYDDQIPLPLTDWLPDLSGEPRRALQVEMGTFNGQSTFRGQLIRNFEAQQLDSQWWLGYETFLTPSAVRRDTFELRVSRTSLKFGMPAYNQWWVDDRFADLGWDRAVLQLAHHSYNPTKDCPIASCQPNTWHWDNVSISRAIPFTILKADLPYVDATSRRWVNVADAAPPGSTLRFMGIGNGIQVSFDGGTSWQAAQRHAVEQEAEEHFAPYWTPIPQGARRVDFRGSDWYGGPWLVRGVSVWSLAPPPPPTDCRARPQASVQTRPLGGGRLEVTVQVSRPLTGPNNMLRGIRVIRADHARVEILGQVFGASGGVVAPPPGATSATFVVTRLTPGAPVTVPLAVVDDCGEWPTFVGGGPSAF